MNAYTVEFFCKCPTNAGRIKYRLRIETDQFVLVERLLAFVSDLEPAYHENLADLLLSEFKGKQTIAAEHHGVTIETTRTE